jgi:hypothetical protein
MVYLLSSFYAWSRKYRKYINIFEVKAAAVVFKITIVNLGVTPSIVPP